MAFEALRTRAIPKSRIFGRSSPGLPHEEDVLGLEVAVDDGDGAVRPGKWCAFAIACASGVSSSTSSRRPSGGSGDRPPLDHGIEREPLEPLECEEGHEALRLEHTEVQRAHDLLDARREAEEQLGLLPELLEEGGALVTGEPPRHLEALQRDRRSKGLVVGAVHDSEATLGHDLLHPEGLRLQGAVDVEGIVLLHASSF
jgi:hypothetical protein